MKAIAKTDCSVTLSVSLDSISLNRMMIKQGQVIDLPVYQYTIIQNKKLREILGDKKVIFKDNNWLIPTYSKNFIYIDE